MVEPLLDQALDLAPAERAAFIQQVAKESRGLARKLAQLLDAAEGADSILIDRELGDVASDLVFKLPAERTTGFASGSVVGPYLLREKLGDGASGQVFAAEHRSDSRRVAIKILVSRQAEAEFVSRFQREQRILSELQHAHVVSAFDSGTCARGFRYIALGLVDGLPITEFCERHQLNFSQRTVLLRQVFSAVQTAHETGVIHRDLKPSNILVEGNSEAGHAFVLDFGIAREQQQAELTMSGQIIGTPGYMSPEQARGESRRVDERSDVFSLGVLCYEVYSGESPFRRDSAIETLAAVIRDTPRPIQELCPNLGPGVASTIHRCLSKLPNERIASVAELAGALDS